MPPLLFAGLPGAGESQESNGSGRKKKPSKSQSLPSLVNGRPSPFADKLQLCTVDVKKRRMVKEHVGGGAIKVASDLRMPFMASERGLEWERSHIVARVPKDRLPPLEEIIRLATEEFGIDLEAPREPPESKRNPAFGGSPPYKPGPRLSRHRQGERPKELPGRRPMPIEEEPAIAEDSPASASQSPRTEAKRASMARGSEVSISSLSALAAATAAAAEEPEEEELPFPWTEDELHSVFSKFDTDHDGEVRTDELPGLLKYLNCRPRQEDVDLLVKEQTDYATLSYDEFVEFIRKFRKLDIEHLREQFVAADHDGNGTLDFNELHKMLVELNYCPTAQSTLEAFEFLDRDKGGSLSFREFEGLREYLRTSEGFTKADVEELKTLFRKIENRGGECDPEEIWRITMYLGYSADIGLVRAMAAQVDADGSGHVSFLELLKIIRLIRDVERDAMRKVMKKRGSGNSLLITHLGLALSDLGYFISEDGLFETLEGIGECEAEDSLTTEEFAALLRGYRFREGFTESELEELTDTFHREGRGEAGTLRTLEVSRVLRWFGFARTLQQVQRLVEEIDFDMSGVLELNEFVKLMRRLHQDEAKRRLKIFNDIATKNTKGIYEVPHNKFGTAARMLAGCDPNPELVEVATKKAIADHLDDGSSPRSKRKTSEDASPTGGGSPVADSQPASLMPTVFVRRPGFESFFLHYRRLVVEEVRASAGYSPVEIARLRGVFDTYDTDKSGTIEKQELMKLIGEYFPDATKSKEGQKDIERALKEVDTDASGALNFHEFLLLMRKCDDSRDSRDIELEQEVIRECQLTPEDVDGFRQIFSANVDWKGEIDIDVLGTIMSRIKELDDHELDDLGRVVREVHPDNRPVARFPQFLKLVKRLTQEETFNHVNAQAARVVRREQKGKDGKTGNRQDGGGQDSGGHMW